MSWLSKGLKKVGKGVKKGLKGVGKAWEKVDDIVLPAVGFALGGPAGAALGSAAARGIGDGKFNAGATLAAGAKGYAGGQLAGMAGIKGGQGLRVLGSSAKNAVTNPIAALRGGGGAAGAVPKATGAVPNLSIGADFTPTVTSAVQGAAQGAAQGAGGIAGGLRKIGDMAGSVQKIAQPLMGGMAMYEGYQNDKRANALNKRQLALAEESYNERKPLRTLGRDLMLDQTPPDLSYIYANSSNPFSRRGA